MATRKSPTSTEKKPSTRKAPAKSTAKVDAAPVAENSIEHKVEKHTPNYEDISQLAEQYWNDRGRPFGSPEVDWLRAEATLLAA